MEKNMIIQTQYKYFSESHAPTSIFSNFAICPYCRLFYCIHMYMYNCQRWADRYFGPLVRWSAAQRTTEMLADQRTGKNSGLAPADYRN